LATQIGYTNPVQTSFSGRAMISELKLDSNTRFPGLALTGRNL